jgi:hypothetical protein
MTMRLRIWVLLGAALCGAAALAADALVPVPLPAAFGLHSIGSAEPVVYTESSGELQNAVDRRVIEAQCEVARTLGSTDKTPVFEAGYDEPLKTETRRFTNDRHWANYTIIHAYVCDRADKPSSSADALCGCNYRVRPKYLVQIKNKLDRGLEIIDIDIAKRTAQRRVVPGPLRDDLERGAADVLRLAPEIVGKDVVAGIPCVMRRQSMGGKNYMDICITEDPDKRLPEQLRYRTLSEYMPRVDGKGVHRSSRADKIVLNGNVDSAVFAIPEGFTVRELK